MHCAIPWSIMVVFIWVELYIILAITADIFKVRVLSEIISGEILSFDEIYQVDIKDELSNHWENIIF